MKTKSILIVICLAIFVTACAIVWQRPTNVLGSVPAGSDYPYATSTRGATGVVLTNFTVLRTGSATLARVVVTGANTGIIRIWDATTTDVTKRAKSTTTLRYVEIPASAAANVYDFDLEFYDGMVFENVGAGLAPTSTLIWR